MALENRLVDLVTKYLFHECRDFTGYKQQDTQIDFLMKAIEIDDLSELFSGINNSHQSYKYAERLKALLENRSPDDLERLNRSRSTFLRSVLTEVLKRTEAEAEARESAYETQRLKSRIIDLEARIAFGKPADKVNLWDRLTSRINLPYLIALMLAVILIAGLALIGLTTTVTVNVDFSLGEIIGGLLIGTGVAAAGISYAVKNDSGGSRDTD